MIFSTSLISAILTFSSFFEKSTAHGDHSSKRLARRMNFVSERSLSACQSSDLLRRGMKRRAEKTKKIRRDLFPQLVDRDLAAVVNISHASNMTAYGDFLFGNNASCILDPEITQGPYYVEGEYIRKDVREDQEGIPLYFEFQVINANTCEPVTDAYFDIWHANATGVYSGIDVSGNGNDADATNVNKTFLRGLQGTDDEGLVEFETIFPGHYQGRATHIHVLSHINGTVFSNGTYRGGSVGHVGQVFWDTDLRAAAELTYPYNTNTQPVTSNEDDEWAAAESENNYDPFADYVYLGDSISDGILAWITVGMDVSKNYYDDLYIAAELTANGGVQNSESFVEYESRGSNSTSTSNATSTAV